MSTLFTSESLCFFEKNFSPIIWWYHCKTTFLNEIYTLTFFQVCTFLIDDIHFSFYFPKQDIFWTIWDVLKSNFQPAHHNNLWLYYYSLRNYWIYTFHERSFALKTNYVRTLSIHYTLNGKTNTFEIKIIFQKMSKIIYTLLSVVLFVNCIDILEELPL